jgi:light-regulated signal transduction histidine kinase (bacteriophytochrome)
MSPSTTETDEARIKRFLAIASHDLQSPLRHIAMYAEILIDELGDSINGEHLDYLNTILAKAQAAQGLTKALVGFAAGAPEMSSGSVNVEQLVREIWAEVRTETDARDATIEIGALPGIRTDPTVLRLALKSIIANALVHRDSAAPRVEIDAYTHDQGWTVGISDNGPGIPAELQGNVFTAFWTMQPDGAAKRPGLGLTAARDLVAALGGSIRLERSDETGSRFTIQLPAR